MARRVIDENLYKALLDAYRDKPGNHSNAARLSGCDRRMAKRGWESGWSNAPWAVPIKVALAREANAARAARADESVQAAVDAETVREKAMLDAVDARLAEGKMVRLARGGATALLAQSARALKAATPLVEHVEKNISDLDGMTVARALVILDRIGKLANQAITTSQHVMRMERLHMGEPETQVSLVVGGLSAEDIRGELREIESTLRAVDVPDAEVTTDEDGDVAWKH